MVKQKSRKILLVAAQIKEEFEMKRNVVVLSWYFAV